MPTEGLVATATWRTDRSLTVTDTQGTDRWPGLRPGDHIPRWELGDTDLTESLRTAHRMALRGRTTTWEVLDAAYLWKAVLYAELTEDDRVTGVVGTAWQLPAQGVAYGVTQVVAQGVTQNGTHGQARTGAQGAAQEVRPEDGDQPLSARTGPAAPVGAVPPPAGYRPPEPPAARLITVPRPVDGLGPLLSELPVPLLEVSAAGLVLGLNPAAVELFHCRAARDLTGRLLHRAPGHGAPATERFTRPDGTSFTARCVRVPSPWDDDTEFMVLHDHIDVMWPEEAGAPERRPQLSPTEAAILELTAQGLTSTQIGARLHFSVNNVEYHLTNMRLRLGGVNRVALVAHAYACGVLPRGVWPPQAVAARMYPSDTAA